MATCRRCEQGRHGECDGTEHVIDQDGHSRYVCTCYCRRQVLEAQRVEHAERRVRNLMREVGIERSHDLVKVHNGGSGTT